MLEKTLEKACEFKDYKEAKSTNTLNLIGFIVGWVVVKLAIDNAISNLNTGYITYLSNLALLLVVLATIWSYEMLKLSAEYMNREEVMKDCRL